MNRTYSYMVAGYAVFMHTDATALLLNEVLEPFGYSFEIVYLDVFEKQFSNLLGLQQGYDPRGPAHLSQHGITVSQAFFDALMSVPFGTDAFMNNQVVLLKKNKLFEQHVIESSVDMGGLIVFAGEMQQFIEKLIHALRLLKSGDIAAPLQFEIDMASRHVVSKLNATATLPPTGQKMGFEQNDATVLKRLLDMPGSQNSMVQLALENFNVSYTVSPPNVKFITLMTALESLFNRGNDQITHIVSRHYALIEAADAGSFKSAYQRMKELYKVRSKIVHGDKPKEDLFALVEELQNKVRLAILICMEKGLDKDALFDYLNAKGF